MSTNKNIFILSIVLLTFFGISCGQTQVDKYSEDFSKKQIKSMLIFPLILIQQKTDSVEKVYAPSWIKPYSEGEILTSDDFTLAQKEIVDWFRSKFPNYKIIEPSTVDYEMSGVVIPTEVDAVAYVTNHYGPDAVFVFKINNYKHTKEKQSEEYVGGFVYQQRELDHLIGDIEFTLFNSEGVAIWKLTTKQECKDRFPMPIQDYLIEFIKTYEIQLNRLADRITSQ